MVNPQQEFAIKGSPKALTSPMSYQKDSMWFTQTTIFVLALT